MSLSTYIQYAVYYSVLPDNPFSFEECRGWYLNGRYETLQDAIDMVTKYLRNNHGHAIVEETVNRKLIYEK